VILGLFFSLGTALVLAAGAEVYFRKVATEGNERKWAPDDYVMFLRRNSLPIIKVRNEEGKKYLTDGARSIPYEKSPARKRLFLLGESFADEWGRVLPEIMGAQGCDALSLGASAADLGMVENQFERSLKYSPDLLVVFVGNNIHFDHPALSEVMYRVYQTLIFARRWSVFADRLLNRIAPEYADVDEAARMESMDRFIRRVTQKSRERNIPVVFCLVPRNHVACGIGLLDPSDDYEPYYLYCRGRRKQAIRYVQEVAKGTRSTGMHALSGAWLYEEGEYEAAQKEVQAGLFNRDRLVNEQIMESSGQAGAWALDIPRAFAQRGVRGVVGYDIMSDRVHANKFGYQLASEALIRLLKEKEWPSAEYPWDLRKRYAPMDWETCLEYGYDAYTTNDDRRFAYIISRAPDRKALKPIVEGYISRAAWMRTDRRMQFILTYSRAFWISGMNPEAFHFCRLARTVDPTSERPDFWEGVYHLSEGNLSEARAFFETGYRKSPEDPKLVFFKNRVLREIDGDEGG